MIDDAQPHAAIRPASERTFTLIPVADIDVVSSRNRGKKQFRENVRSIAENGLYKPILVNVREHARTGRYQLICGEGRLQVHIELQKELIKAEIVDVDLATAHIMSLGENMTKTPPKPIEYAYSLLEMYDKGTQIADLERITGQTAQYIKGYINLVRGGEERLIKGVETGLFPLDFAMRVAESSDGAVQHVLMDAFDKKFITAKHVDSVRKILVERTRHGKGLKASNDQPAGMREGYTVDDLKRDIQRITREKEKFVYAVESKETRLVRLHEGLKRIRGDEIIMNLLRHRKLDGLPSLEGTYGG
jgi:ParB family chromosome partitioning protein